MSQKSKRKIFSLFKKAFRVSDKESNFNKEKAAQAEKVSKENDPFLEW